MRFIAEWESPGLAEACSFGWLSANGALREPQQCVEPSVLHSPFILRRLGRGLAVASARGRLYTDVPGVSSGGCARTPRVRVGLPAVALEGPPRPRVGGGEPQVLGR